MTHYEDFSIHPLADAFPLIEGKEFDELCQSIEDDGLREPIVMQDGVLIDGRNRLRACLHVGVAPDFTEYDEDIEVPEYIWIKNALRRHLSDDGRAAAATTFLGWEEDQRQKALAETMAKARESRWVEPEEIDEDEEQVEPNSVQPVEPAKPNATARAIAERAGVSKHKAVQAIAVKKYDDEHGTDLIKKVTTGEVKLRDAAKVAKPNNNKLAPQWRMDRAITQFRLYIGVRIRECPQDQREEYVCQLEEAVREVYENEQD